MYTYSSYAAPTMHTRTFSASLAPTGLTRNFCRALLFFALMVVSAHAQSTDAVISGTITDSAGAVLSNASITARNDATGVSRNILSGSNGQYRLTALPSGNYALTVQREGFAEVQVSGIDLSVGLEYQRDVTLKIGGVQEAVNVTAQQPLVESTSSEAGAAVITQVQIDSLPIPGRQATQLALLLPGTGTDSTRTQRPDANVGAGDVNVASTNYLVDGLTNMISGQGDPRDNIPQAAVQEFKVITSQAPAEYGGRSGGVVTLVTRSGGNEFHGEGFEFFRNHAINRVDYYTQQQHDSAPSVYPIEPFSRNQFGGAGGGPIIKDRLHFFTSFERLDDREYFTVAPGGAAASSAVKTDYAALQGSYRNGSLQNSYFGRIDWNISPKQTLFVKFFEQNPSIFYCLGCAGGNNAAFSSGDTSVRGWTYAAGHTWVISPRVVNQLNVQIAEDWQSSLPSRFNTPSQALLDKANAATAGYRPANVPVTPGGSTTYSFPSLKWGFYPGTNFHPFYQEAVEALSWNTGKHNFKFGGSILNEPRKTQAVATPLGSWTFANDHYFNPNDPNFDWSTLSEAGATRWTTTFPTIPYVDFNVVYGFYAQDEWKVRPGLTLNVGLRYDLQTKIWRNSLYQGLYPTPLPYVDFKSRGDHNNVAPRLGFAWDPRNDGKTVIRGGFGIVYTANQGTNFGGEVVTTRQTSITLNSSTVANVTTYVPYPDPYNGKGYQSAISNTPPNITINANNISNPPVVSSSLGFSRELANNLAINIDGLYSHFSQMPINVNINSPVNPSAPKVLPLTAWGQINQTQPIGTYGYKALYVRLDKRLSRHYQYTVSYTLAKQNDNYNNSTAITDFYHPTEDLGTSAVDRRHNLVVSGSIFTKYGITVGGIYSVRSSLPLSATTGTDNNADGSTTDYVPGTIKNAHDKSQLLSVVNSWRKTQKSNTSGVLDCVGVAQCLAPIPLSQIQTNFYNQLDARVAKQFSFTERYRLQIIGQLFNVFGTDNFGGVGSSQGSNASSSTFGIISAAQPRQQGELAVRFLF